METAMKEVIACLRGSCPGPAQGWAPVARPLSTQQRVVLSAVTQPVLGGSVGGLQLRPSRPRATTLALLSVAAALAHVTLSPQPSGRSSAVAQGPPSPPQCAQCPRGSGGLGGSLPRGTWAQRDRGQAAAGEAHGSSTRVACVTSAGKISLEDSDTGPEEARPPVTDPESPTPTRGRPRKAGLSLRPPV